MKHLKLFENFESIKYPDLVTVKLTDEWKNSHNLFRMPSEVDLLNNDEKYTYIGNTKLDGYSGILYFASRRDNQVFITGLEEGAYKDYDINSLTDPHYKSKSVIENSGLRKFPSGICRLGKLDEPHYSGELEVGMTDNRGYFEIVDLK